MTRCKTCGGQLVDRDLDFGACCLQCGRPAAAPQPPLWLLDDPRSDYRFVRRERQVVRREAAAVASVTVADMRAAMAGAR